MAKVERQFSRAAAALADEEGFDEVFRSHAVDRPRPATPFPGAEALRPGMDDDELPLRTRRRVPQRRSLLPRHKLGRILILAGVVAALCLVVAGLLAVHSFFMQDARFRVESASSIQVLGNAQVTRPELLSVFGGDIGRNIFHVPLAMRRAQLEELPWVEHATVMRLLPNQLRVSVTERTPVAFVREGNHIGLVDRHGILLDMPPTMLAAKRYSFPVVNGVTETESAEERAARMRLYADFMHAMDQAGASEQLSEVDLSDPEDVRVLLPSAGNDLLVHFGSDGFAERWQRLQQKLPGWRQQYPRLAGVDLRYQRQTVLEMAKPPQDEAAAQADAAPARAAALKPAPQGHANVQHGREQSRRSNSTKNSTRNAARKPVVTKKPAHPSTATHAGGHA